MPQQSHLQPLQEDHPQQPHQGYAQQPQLAAAESLARHSAVGPQKGALQFRPSTAHSVSAAQPHRQHAAGYPAQPQAPCWQSNGSGHMQSAQPALQSYPQHRSGNTAGNTLLDQDAMAQPVAPNEVRHPSGPPGHMPGPPRPPDLGPNEAVAPALAARLPTAAAGTAQHHAAAPQAAAPVLQGWNAAAAQPMRTHSAGVSAGLSAQAPAPAAATAPGTAPASQAMPAQFDYPSSDTSSFQHLLDVAEAHAVSPATRSAGPVDSAPAMMSAEAPVISPAYQIMSRPSVPAAAAPPRPRPPPEEAVISPAHQVKSRPPAGAPAAAPGALQPGSALPAAPSTRPAALLTHKRFPRGKTAANQPAAAPAVATSAVRPEQAASATHAEQAASAMRHEQAAHPQVRPVPVSATPVTVPKTVRPEHRQLESYLPAPLCNAFKGSGLKHDLYDWQVDNLS